MLFHPLFVYRRWVHGVQRTPVKKKGKKLVAEGARVTGMTIRSPETEKPTAWKRDALSNVFKDELV